MSLSSIVDVKNGSRPFGISVHLGAFATSASFLQSVLKSGREQLSREGICYLGPDQLRGAQGLVLPGGREKRTPAACADFNAEALGKHLDEHVRRYPLKHLILSDGALLGSSRRLTINGHLYPHATLFLSALPTWIDDENTTVLLSIRHLGDLISEEICRVAMRSKIPDIARIEENLWNDLGSWSTIIARIESHFEKSKLMVWRHEDFDQLSGEILRGLTKRKLVHADRIKPTPLLSARALEYMKDFADPSGKMDIPSLRLNYSIKQFPVSSTNPAFSLGDAALRELIDVRYQDDWAEINEMWPDSVLRRIDNCVQ